MPIKGLTDRDSIIARFPRDRSGTETAFTEAIEAELVYRARDTAGRADAAYVIQFTTTSTYFQVTAKWGRWERYRNATLQSKEEYTGSSRSAAQSAFILAMGKREQRGYELQAGISTFPSWYPSPYTRTVTITADDSQLRQALAETQVPALPEPEPPPAGRVKHTRAGFIEL